MTGYEFGDVVLVSLQFSDLSGAKRRPAVVVSSAAYHRDHRDLLLLAITSRLPSRPRAGEATLLQWQQAGLLVPSAFKPFLATLDKSLVLRKLGRLAEEDRAGLERVLREIVGE